jgi:hypothetical protein
LCHNSLPRQSSYCDLAAESTRTSPVRPLRHLAKSPSAHNQCRATRTAQAIPHAHRVPARYLWPLSHPSTCLFALLLQPAQPHNHALPAASLHLPRDPTRSLVPHPDAHPITQTTMTLSLATTTPTTSSRCTCRPVRIRK